MQRWSILETGHCVCLEVVSHLSSVGPCKKKKKTAKGKEAFQGKFVFIVEDSLVNFFGKTEFLPVHSRLQA